MWASAVPKSYLEYDTVLVLRDTKTGAETTRNDAVTGIIAPVVSRRS
jgi:hypothetical protein